MKHKRQCQLLVVSLCGVATAAQGIEYTGSLGFGAWWSDNENQSRRAPRDEITLEPNVGLNLTHDSATLQLNADYRAERRDFVDDVFDDRTLVTGRGRLNWEPIADRFDIRILQDSTEGSNQVFARAIQANRQQISTTEASPRLRFRPRAGDELQFELRYRELDSEVTNIDSQTQDQIVRYRLGLNRDADISFELIDGSTEYDAVTAPEVERFIYQATYTQRDPRGSVTATLGQTKFTRRGLPDTEGFNGRLAWTKRFHERSSLTLSALRNISDGSDQFLNRDGLDNPLFPGVQIENTDLTDLFIITRFDATYAFQAGVNAISVNAQVQNRDFERFPRDQDQLAVVATVNRPLRRRLDGSLALRYVDADFEQVGEATGFKQLFLNADLFWEPMRDVETILRLSYINRSDGQGTGEVDEFRFYIGVRYQFGTGQRTPSSFRGR